MRDYAKVLSETDVRLQKMLAAFNVDEYPTGHNQADEIGALYEELYPDAADEFIAERLANLVKTVASVMYFGGLSYGIKQQIEEQAKARERKFAPPF